MLEIETEMLCVIKYENVIIDNCLCDWRSAEAFKWVSVEKSQILLQDAEIK